MVLLEPVKILLTSVKPELSCSKSLLTVYLFRVRRPFVLFHALIKSIKLHLLWIICDRLISLVDDVYRIIACAACIHFSPFGCMGC